MKALTNEEFIKKLKSIKDGRFIALEPYKTAATKIKFKHLPCGTEFYARPNDILDLRSEGCPKCGAIDRKVHRTKNIQTLIKEVNELYPDNRFYIYPNQTIINNKTKIKVKCNKCGHDFMIAPSNILRDRGCPSCSTTASNKSKNSTRIANYLKTNGYEQLSIIDKNKDKYFIREVSFKDLYDESTRRKLWFDFAIYHKDQLQFLIEYDGEFHFRNPLQEGQLEIQQKHDQMKNDYCKKKDIILYRFNYKNFNAKNYKQLLNKCLSSTSKCLEV